MTERGGPEGTGERRRRERRRRGGFTSCRAGNFQRVQMFSAGTNVRYFCWRP